MYLDAGYVELAAHDAQNLAVLARVGEYDDGAARILRPVFVEEVEEVGVFGFEWGEHVVLVQLLYGRFALFFINNNIYCILFIRNCLKR